MITTALACTLIAGGAVAGVAPAEKLRVTATVQGGSGLSLAGANGQTLGARSPVFLTAEVGFTHPQVRWLEFSPGIIFEVEGRVGFGLLPKMRLFIPVKRVELYGFGALPIFVAPFSLLGALAGAGLAVPVLKNRLALVGEVSGGAYFWGSDLMEGAALGKLDGTLGVRVYF